MSREISTLKFSSSGSSRLAKSLFAPHDGGFVDGSVNVGDVDLGVTTFNKSASFDQVVSDDSFQFATGPQADDAHTSMGTPTDSLTMTTDSLLTAESIPTVTVADGANVEIGGFSPQWVAFTGTTGTLKIDHSLAYNGKISGLTGSDGLDLSDVSYGANTTATFLGDTTGGTLTVTDGTHTANISLIGDYLSSGWTLSNDGSGGTTVVDPVPANDWQTLKVGAGGFVTGIDIAPDDTMVVRTDTYGAYIWNGTQWQQLVTSTSMPAAFSAGAAGGQGVYEIQVAPSNSNIMYMDYGGYVFASNDKGATWTQTAFAHVTESANDAYRMNGQKMAIDPNDFNVVYVGTPQNGLLVTTNGGASWQNVSDVPVSAKDSNGVYPGITGIEFDPANTNNIFASSYGNGVYESTNAGASWSKLSGGPSNVEYAAISSTGVYYAVGDNNTDLWSYANGAWTELLLNSSLGGNGVHTVAIDPFNQSHIVISTPGGNLDQSFNGGATWSGIDWNNKLSATDIPWLATSGQYMTIGGTVFDQLDPGKLWTSSGVGVWNTSLPQSFTTPITWHSQSIGIEQLVANEIIVPPGGNPILASWDRPFIDVSSPDSYASSYGPVNGKFAAGWSIDYASSSPNFLVGIADWWGTEESGYSTNGGQSWTPFSSFIPGAGSSFIGGTIAASSTTNFVWAPADGFDPYYTKDGGVTWNPIVLPGVSSWSGFDFAYYLDARTVTADRVLPNTFYLYDAGHGVYQSTDGGSTWTQVFSGNISAFSNFNSELASVPGEAGNLFFTGGPQTVATHPASEGFFQSTNGGASWTAVANVKEVATFGFGAPAPGQTYPSIYIVGYVNSVYGIWQSNDDAKSWTEIGTYPAGSLSNIKTIAGDPNAYGQVYVGFNGDGYAVLKAAPTAVAVPAINSFSPDSGTVGDGITNDNTLTLTGTAEANSTIKVYDGATLLGTATTDASGAWSYITAALSNGAHSFTATDTDVAGNTSVASAALSVTIDTTAPAAPAIASFSTDIGVEGDHITNGNTLTLTGTAEANSTIKVYDGATLLGTATTDGNGAWNYVTAALSDGAHSLTAIDTDAAGNTSVASAALVVTVDTLAPNAPVITGDAIVNVHEVSLTGTAEANSTINVYEGTTLLGTAMADGKGAWNFITPELPVGSHNLTATDTDAAGNTSSLSQTVDPTIDPVSLAAPLVSCLTPVGDGITNVNTLTLTGTAEANSTVKVYDGTTLLGTTTVDGSGAWTYTTAALTDGAHSLTTVDTDAAGDASAASATLAVIVDTLAPTLAITEMTTTANSVSLTGTAEAHTWIAVYDSVSGFPLGTTTTAADGTWSLQETWMTSSAVTVTATDLAGNTSHADATAPSATVTSLVEAGPGTVTLSGTSSADSTVSIYDGTASTPLGTVTADAGGAWSFTTGTLSNAVHDFTLKAVDVAGNTGSGGSAAIYGTAGNDTITIGSGSNLVVGGGGSDTFVFGPNLGKDVIADFQASSHDVLQFSQNTFNDFAAVLAHAAQVGSDVVITADPIDTVTLKNVQLASLQQNNIHIV